MRVIDNEVDELALCTNQGDDEDEEVQPLPVFVVTCPFPYDPTPNIPKGLRYKWCDLCNKKFHTEGGLRRHMRADHPKEKKTDENLPTVQCSLCNVTLKVKSQGKYKRDGRGVLKYHMQKEHKEEEAKEREAKEAKLRLKREEELQKAKAEVILCRSCDFQANPLCWRRSMKKHMEEEHGNQVGLLILQFSDEMEGGKYSCRLCPRSTSSSHPPYRNSESLRQHLKRKHGIGRDPLPCPVCDKLVRSSASLKVHMKKRHSTEELKRAAGL